MLVFDTSVRILQALKLSFNSLIGAEETSAGKLILKNTIIHSGLLPNSLRSLTSFPYKPTRHTYRKFKFKFDEG